MKRILASLALVGMVAVPALAQGQWGQSWSPNDARDARQRGDIKPLKDIYRDLRNRYGGYQIDTALYSNDEGGSDYHISWMTEDGRKIDLVVDARTGEIKSVRGA